MLFKTGLIFMHRYDEDRDKRKKWNVNPIQERQNINRWLEFIQTIFWTLPNPIQTMGCPNQLLNHSAGPAIPIRLVSTILWDVFHPSKDTEYLN